MSKTNRYTTLEKIDKTLSWVCEKDEFGTCIPLFFTIDKASILNSNFFIPAKILGSNFRMCFAGEKCAMLSEVARALDVQNNCELGICEESGLTIMHCSSPSCLWEYDFASKSRRQLHTDVWGSSNLCETADRVNLKCQLVVDSSVGGIPTLNLRAINIS